jgi:hypothetical protein
MLASVGLLANPDDQGVIFGIFDNGSQSLVIWAFHTTSIDGDE